MSGGPEDRLDSLENDFWGHLRRGALQIKDERKRRAAVAFFESESVEEVSEKIDKLRRGTWVDNLILGASAVAGGVIGFHTQRVADIRAGAVPITGLLGLGGVVPGLAMNRSMTARNTLGLGGLLFLAGAGLYTSTHPLVDEESEEA